MLYATVAVMANEVNDAIYRLVNSTLKAISLTQSEYREFSKLGIDCCPLATDYKPSSLPNGKSFLQLDNQRFQVYLPISTKDVIELDQPVIEKMIKSFFNYVIHDSANDMDYTWRSRRRADKILGYNNPRYDTYSLYNNSNTINRGLGLFNSKDVAYNGYYYLHHNGLFCDGYHLIEDSMTIVGFGEDRWDNGEGQYMWENWESLSFIDLKNLNLGNDRIIRDIIYKRRREDWYQLKGTNANFNEESLWFKRIKDCSEFVLPEEIAYALDNISENERMEIAKKIIPKKELKEYSKKKQVVDGKIIASYIPVEKKSNNLLLSYPLSFFFTEEEISRFTGLEIVPHKYL